MKLRKSGVLVLVTFLSLAYAALSFAGSCQEADKIFHNIDMKGDPEKALNELEKVISLCPAHWAALNNMGLIHEKKKELDQAEVFYKKALKAKPEALHPLAGLGDVAMARGQYGVAEDYYKKLLAGMDSGVGLHFNLMNNKNEYQAKLKYVREKMAYLEKSADGSVGRQYIVRSLNPSNTRGWGGKRQRAGLALKVLFDYDSAEIKPKSENLLKEVAGAINSDPTLAKSRIAIIGHTDTKGGDAYNQKLSLRRAQSVKAFLVKQGVIAENLLVEGKGEKYPLVPGGSKEEQAKNRRVEFINKSLEDENSGYLSMQAN